MGKRLKIYNTDFSYLLPETLVYTNASGITDLLVINALNTFILKLKQYNIWDKIDNAYAFLGTTESQIKFNLKTGADPLTNAGGGTILNTINKGIVLEGVGDSQGNTVDVPLTQTFMQSLRDGSGHALYFINEDLVATNTLVPGLGIPLSNNKFTSSATPIFHLSGAYGTGGSSMALGAGGKAFMNTSANFKNKGSFGVVKNGADVEYVGNGVSLGLGTVSGSNSSSTGNVRIGDGRFPVANTVSFISFGLVAMSSSEMISYQTAINDLIHEVHGITV